MNFKAELRQVLKASGEHINAESEVLNIRNLSLGIEDPTCQITNGPKRKPHLHYTSFFIEEKVNPQFLSKFQRRV